MKCPNDQTAMEEGNLVSGSVAHSRWVSSESSLTQNEVVVYKCPTCGKMEFYVKGKE